MSYVPFRIHQAAQTTETAAIVLLSSKHYPILSQSHPDASSSKTKILQPKFDIWAVQLDLSIINAEQAELPRMMNILWHRRGKDVPLYTTYDRTRQAFAIVGNSTYTLLQASSLPSYEPSVDEFAPVPRAGERLDGDQTGPIQTQVQKPPPYSWTQTSDAVTIAIPLPSSTSTQNIKVAFSTRTLTVLVQGTGIETQSNVIPLPRFSLKALWDGIQPSTSLWTWDKSAEHSCGILTLHLDKQHEGTRWPQVFASPEHSAQSSLLASTSQDHQIEDIEVPETLDPSELYNIREALEKYTAALRDGEDASGLGLGRGVPSLAEGEMDEEVDETVGRSVCVSWVSLTGQSLMDSREESTPINVLSLPLPGIYPEPPQPSLIVRNGIDGLLHVLEPATSPDDRPKWTHRSTYSALSFVLASKRDTRFVHHVSSEAVFAFESGARELGGNVYIYRGAPNKREQWAKQAVLKIGGGSAGSLLGVGIVRRNKAGTVILCLCEGELIVMHNVL